MQEVYKKYPFDRFIFRQQYNYQRALTEIREGKKESCWMWYIFHQLRQLGTSRKSYVFGIIDADHANAYLKNPVLGPRLIECCNALLTHFDKSAEDILGEIDAQKLFSSMTLFASISEDNSIFHKVLCRFYGGEKDNKTLQILRRQKLKILRRNTL